MSLEWQYLIPAIGVTTIVWTGAILTSAMLAAPIVIARRSHSSLARAVATAWTTLARGIPPVMWLIIIYFGLSVGVFSDFPALAAVVGLGIVNSAYFADSIRAGLDSIPQGQWEAIEATGMSATAGFRHVVLPQAFPIMLASAVAYSITLLKNTALASIIGANELMYFAANKVQTGSDPLFIFLSAGVIYLLLTVPLGILARTIESRSVIAAVR